MQTDTNPLRPFRTDIDTIDEKIIRLLGQRYAICRKVGNFKKENDIPMMQSGRVDAVKERCAALGAEHGVDPDFVRELYSLIIEESCRIEDEIIGKRT